MNRRERMMATMRGEPVDRPAVSFYELNGLDEDPHDPDPFNIYTDPSWAPLIQLTRERTDRMVLRSVPFRAEPGGGSNQAASGGGSSTSEPGAESRPPACPAAYPSTCPADDAIHINPIGGLGRTEVWLDAEGRRFSRRTIPVAGGELTSLTRRDPDVNTIWTVEPLLKEPDDLRRLLELPWPVDIGRPDLTTIVQTEAALGDSGIVLLDTPDPLCLAAGLFEMGMFTIVALSEPDLFHAALERFATTVQARTEAVAAALPGRLWRIHGPEYASPPYLPPALFREYVVRYDRPMVAAIHRHGGFCRIHSHGNLRAILADVVSTGCMGLDPVEPPPQGDVSLAWVRQQYGRELVLFGNLEISDIELLSADAMAGKTRQALAEGTSGAGRGFVLMPSACPYGRKLSARALRNYATILEVVDEQGRRRGDA